jgi:hypothetical protein
VILNGAVLIDSIKIYKIYYKLNIGVTLVSFAGITFATYQQIDFAIE